MNLDFVFRDPYPSDPGYVYDEKDIWLFERGWTPLLDGRRQQLEELMPTYRPTQHPLHGIRPGA